MMNPHATQSPGAMNSMTPRAVSAIVSVWGKAFLRLSVSGKGSVSTFLNLKFRIYDYTEAIAEANISGIMSVMKSMPTQNEAMSQPWLTRLALRAPA